MYEWSSVSWTNGCFKMEAATPNDFFVAEGGLSDQQ